MDRDAGIPYKAGILMLVALVELAIIYLSGDSLVEIFDGISSTFLDQSFLFLASFVFIVFGLFVLGIKKRYSKVEGPPRPRDQDRSYTLVLAATFFYGTVNGLLFITLPIYVNDLSDNLFLVGLTVSLPFLAIFVMSFIWGALTDSLGSRKGVLVVSMVIHGLLYLPMPFLDIYSLIILRAVQVFFASSNALGMALITEFAPTAKGAAIGEVSEWTAVGWLVGGVASGFVYYYGDVTILFPLCLVFGMSAGLVLVPMREIKKTKAIDTFKTIFKLEKKEEISLIFIVVGLTYISNNVVFTLFPVYLKDLSLTEDVIGVLTAAAGLVGALVVAFVGKVTDKYGRRPIFIFAVALYFVDWIVLVLTENLIIVTIIWVVPSWAFIVVSGTTMVSDLTSTGERGRGIGGLNSALNLGSFTGSALSGLVATWLYVYFPDIGPYRAAFIFATFFTLIPIALSFKIKETLPGKRPNELPTEEE
jgi:MFS family permease